MYKGVKICGIMKTKHSFGHNHQGDERNFQKKPVLRKIEKRTCHFQRN